jgi:signal transduction histidine kinase
MLHRLRHFFIVWLALSHLARLMCAGAEIITDCAQVRSLSNEKAAQGLSVAITGVVVHRTDSPTPGLLVLHDGQNGIFVKKSAHAVSLTAEVGQQVRVTGVTSPGRISPVIQAHDIEILGTATLPHPLLTSAAAIRALPRAVANQMLPVRISGVVCYKDAVNRWNNSAFLLHDGEQGIYCTPSPYLGKKWPDLKVGDQVEITGLTEPGGFAPIIQATGVLALGPGMLPVHRSARMWELRNGRYDCQLVRVEGVVRRMHLDGNGVYRLEMAEQDGTFSAFVSDPEGKVSTSLVDARLRLEGVCFVFFNPRGESTGINLRVSSPEHLTVLKPGSEDPFSAPLADSLALNPFHPDDASLHRQRIIGTVVLSRPGAFFYLQCAERTFQVHTRQGGELLPGEVVETSGFVEQTPNFAILTEAVYRIIGKTEPPKPLVVSSEDLLSAPGPDELLRKEDYDGALITITATLLKADQDDQGVHRLHVLHENVVRIALLGSQIPKALVSRLLPGSVLELTGVCEQRLDRAWPNIGMPKAAGFSLHLRDLDDVRVLTEPSWWTVRRLTLAMLVCASMAALILVWNVSLSRTVSRQTALISGRIARETRLEERQRIGRELHDTLQQELTGIGMLIGNSKANLNEPEKAKASLTMAERMVLRASMESRSSIQDLVSATLEHGGLQSAIEELVKPMAELNGARLQTQFPEPLPPLPTKMLTGLLRIAHEAAANAGKHAAAREVFLHLEIHPDEVRLIIRDDGVGFDLAEARASGHRHFGLLTMEERAIKLKGHLTMKSNPGEGTTVTATLPLL